MSRGAGGEGKAAAFFDVDGTLVHATIVHYYVYFRRARMSPFLWRFWYPAFLAKCGYYLVLDKFDRSLFNRVFYRSYAGLPVAQIKAQVPHCYREVIKPRCFAQVDDCVAGHRENGDRVVLVTGSIDFIIEPLARDLAIESVIAPTLVASNGSFTGELDGPPLSEGEKAGRVRGFAETEGIDLSRSHAYGDSIADLAMLEVVGHPHVVNPDKALKATATRRGWRIHHWTIAHPGEGSD